jgi:predicted TIM-barrel fold metal-dependent hydrolase
MNRRRLLLAAASAAFGAETPIMDTHVHFYDPARPGGVPWPSPKDKVLYRRAMPADYQALSKAHVIIVEASRLFSDNQWILDLAAQHRFVAGCVGNLDPADAAFAQHIADFKKNPKFLGIRLGVNRAQENLDKLKPLEDAGLALDLIGNAEMYPLAARLSDRYPKLRMILDHLPLAQQDAGIRELRERKNVYAKVSWILRAPDDKLEGHLEALDEVWSVFGENRVVYGSNWPVSDLIVPYSKIQETAIEYFRKKPLKKYLWENSRAIYRWGK